jgi:hypothetical protein
MEKESATVSLNVSANDLVFFEISQSGQLVQHWVSRSVWDGARVLAGPDLTMLRADLIRVLTLVENEMEDRKMLTRITQRG